jgi:hypothetical protein
VLLVLRVECGRCEGAEVVSWHAEVGYLKARIVGGDGGRDEWGKCLGGGQSQRYGRRK